jgi:hypothetical protein
MRLSKRLKPKKFEAIVHVKIVDDRSQLTMSPQQAATDRVEEL